MKRRRTLLGKLLGIIVLASTALSGCLSLEYDITPPPDDTRAEGVIETPMITQAPTRTAPPPAASLEAEEAEGEGIVVDVVDQSGGLLLEQGLEVELAGYDQFELVFQDVKTLTQESRLVFENVPFQAGMVYFASISHGGAVYRSEFVESGDDTTFLQLTIQVFETTTSDEAILIERIHVLVEFPSPDLVQIVEIFIISNLGDATLVAENPGEVTVSFPLPPEAESISFDDGVLGERYIKTQDGFGDTVSIPPGSGVYQNLVYYTLPFKRNRLDFSQVMGYPVQAAIIMTPAGEVVVEGSNLVDMGVQAILDGSVQVYSVSSIPREESLEFRISAEADSSADQTPAPVFLPQGIVIAAGVVGGVLFLSGIWLSIRQRGQNLEENEEYAEEREEILDSIIALEDIFKEGEIAKKTYLKKRQELIDRLDSLADDKINTK